MGVVNATRGLLTLNQKGGIDCQSCAWPDPDGKRTLAEFCESGAKALPMKAQRDASTREFFAKYSIEELSAKDDLWLDPQGGLQSRRSAKRFDAL